MGNRSRPSSGSRYDAAVTLVLLATDSDSLFADVDGAVTDDSNSVIRVRSGAEVTPVVAARKPDVVLCDLQSGTMGGVAASLNLYHEASAGRIDAVPVGLLLDREADVFLASQAHVDGWVVKPLNAIRLRRLVTALATGESYFDGHEPASQTLA